MKTDRKKKIIPGLHRDTMELERMIEKMQSFACFGDWIWDVKSDKLACSDGMYKIFGFEKDKFEGSIESAIFNMIHPDDRAGAENIKTVLKNLNRPGPFECRIVMPDMSIHVIRAEWCDPEVDRNGKPVSFRGFIQDITDRKNREEALNADRELYSSLCDSMLNGFAFCKMIFDHNGSPADYVFLKVNRAFRELTGISDFEGRAASEVIPGMTESYPELFQVYCRVSTSGSPERIDVLFKPAGKWISVLVNSTKSGYFTAVFEDISGRKRLEEALNSNAEKYRQLFEAESDSLFLIDEESGMIYEANTAALRSYGYTYEEMLTKRNTDMSAEPEMTMKAMENRENYIPVRWHKKKDGTVFPVEISVSHLVLNERPAIIAAIRDITERKNADDRIQSLLLEKEYLLKEVHQSVKENMNTIYRLLVLQSHALSEPSAIAAINDTKNRVQSMRVLYEKLSRSDDFRGLSIKEYLTKMVEEMTGASMYCDNVTVNFRIEDFIVGTKIMFPLGLIVNELVLNAMKYAFCGMENKIVTISASKRDSTAVITVHDNGKGLPESINFWSRSSNLGLNMVSMLTEQIGGSIRIQRGDGTAFILEFNV